MNRVADPLAIDQIRLAEIIREACELDVKAFKPGNVSIASPGHGMTADDFLVSAEAIVQPLTTPGASVGQRIFQAVAATRACVECNTNLGIVLIAAPLIYAVQEGGGADLRTRLQRALNELTRDDAALAYRAIRLAQPGGLGASVRHDVAGEPSVTLLEAMREAADRDSIARQYATGYLDIFETGVPRFREASSAWQNAAWAAVAVYVELLAKLPDTLVVRKFGNAGAEGISKRAAALNDKIKRSAVPWSLLPELRAWDAELKQAGLNAGTTADLTVGTIIATRLQDSLSRF